MSVPTTAAKRKKSASTPSLDHFHTALQRLAPHLRFTKDAVIALRECHASFLREVAGQLVEHDRLDLHKVAQACSLGGTPAFVEWTQEAQALLEEEAAQNPKPKKKAKKGGITAEMEAQQEELLQKSKAAMIQQEQQKQQPPKT